MLENMKKREVLIIEDNPDSLKALFNELKEKNWTYRRTLNLSDAIKVLKGDKHNISLILLDQNLSDWITPEEVVMALINYSDNDKNSNIELHNSIKSMNREGLLLIPWLIRNKNKYNLDLKVIVTSFHQDNNLMQAYLEENDKKKLFLGFIPKPLTFTKITDLIKKECSNE